MHHSSGVSSSSVRPTIPTTWRDHLARAINERDLARIEALIETGHEHNHNRFNDPLVADAHFLLQVAQERAGAASQNRKQLRQAHGFNKNGAAGTSSRMADQRAGGMSWVAPPIAAFAQSNRKYDPTGNTPSLRERVSQLREMALFPTPASNLHDSSIGLAGGGAGVNRSASIMSVFSSVRAYDGPAETRDTQEAAAAMGVPPLWISPPTELNTEPNNNNNNNVSNNNVSRTASPASRRSYSVGSPRSSSFVNNDVTSAALRLHSFVHKDEEPTVKSSRLFAAYISAEREAPRDGEMASISPRRAEEEQARQEAYELMLQQQLHQAMINQAAAESSQQNVAAVAVSVSPSRSASRARSPGVVSSPSQSPEHHRLLRKLRHEASAPEGVELTRMLRFLGATEAMDRGVLEQEQEHSFRSGLASLRYSFSRGISSSRELKPNVFLDN